MADLVGWRITKEKHSKDAFSGEGARIFGGRWNSVAVPVVYCSENLSLAALETLVHIVPATLKDKYRAYQIRFDESLLASLIETKLPKGWNAEPPTAVSQKIGDEWIKAGRSAVLSVPTVLVPFERTLLLNPKHPDFKKIKIRDTGRFMLDPRLKR